MSVAELERQLKEAIEQARVEGNESWKQLAERVKPMTTWSVSWDDKYQVHIGLCYTPEALALIEELDKKYPTSMYRIHEDSRRWRGMTYMLISNVLVQAGGGWCVLKVDRNTFRSWRELTAEQESALRAGQVPDELKAM